MGLVANLTDRLRNHKLSRDIAYTLGSFVVLAASGIVINVIIASLRDAAALGVFNQSYAIYIVASQLAALGIHFSVMRYAALHEQDAVEQGRLLFSALVCTMLLGFAAMVILLLLAPVLGDKFDSAETGAAIGYAAIGLLLFPSNKVLLAYLNGLRRMRAFSLLQSTRYLIVTAAVSFVAASDLAISVAGLGFAIAELVTFLSAVLYLYRNHLAVELRLSASWVREHFRFGSRGLMAGMFAEANSRVDVVMIGLFLPDRAAGIYSFGAMLVDGLYHVLAMVRINFNPILVGAMRDGDWRAPMRLLAQCKRFVLPGTVAVSALLVGVLYFTGTYLLPEKGLLEGLPSVVVLLVGLTLVSPFVPFDNLLLVVGHPGYQTLQYLTAVVANILLAAILLPLLGIVGAALGTAASYIAGIALLLFLARSKVRWNLVTNSRVV